MTLSEATIRREEWLLSQSIEAELDLARIALVKVDDLERAGAGDPSADCDDDRLSLANEALSSHVPWTICPV